MIAKVCVRAMWHGLAFRLRGLALQVSKETYAHGKRDLCICQKRPAAWPRISLARAGIASVKRDSCIWQKRPMHMSKEAS